MKAKFDTVDSHDKLIESYEFDSIVNVTIDGSSISNFRLGILLAGDSKYHVKDHHGKTKENVHVQLSQDIFFPLSNVRNLKVTRV